MKIHESHNGSEFVPLDVAGGIGGACGLLVASEEGSCSEILSSLASLGVGVLWGHVEGGRGCRAYFVLPDRCPRGLEDELRRSGRVSYVRAEDMDFGLPAVFPILAGGVRAVALREDIAKGLMRGMVGELGEGVWSVLLYHTGREYGRAAYKRHLSTLGSGASRGELLRIAEEMFRALGYGVLEQEVDEETGTVHARIKESFECRALGSMGRRGRTSNFFRGTLSGWFSEFLGSDVRCEETACINEGAPYCEFVCRRTGAGDAEGADD